MQLEVRPEFSVLAQGIDEQIAVLVEITAPHLDPAQDDLRPQHTLQVVLDRSGSMGRGRLEVAKTALLEVVQRLRGEDNFGLVAFDDEARVVVPAGPLTDKRAAKRAIEALRPGGSTHLSAGYLCGVREAERVAGAAGAAVLLISDGRANRGVVDPAALGESAREAFGRGVTTSTLGVGKDYDEDLLAALARDGRGNHEYALHSKDAAQFITGEADGLLAQAAQVATLLVRADPAVRGVEALNDAPVTTTADGTLIELGSLYSGESRTLTLVFDVPAVAAPCALRPATMELSWTELPALAPRTAAAPLELQVVRAEAAADRVRDPKVSCELVFQHAQQAKQRALDALRRRDVKAALEELRSARDDVAFAAADAPQEMAQDLAEELTSLTELIRDAESGRHDQVSKASMRDVAGKSRNRGRRLPGVADSARQTGPARWAKQPRRAWIDLAEAIRTLPLTAQDREPIAEALAALLDGRPDFDPGRFRYHAVSTDPYGRGTYPGDSLF